MRLHTKIKNSPIAFNVLKLSSGIAFGQLITFLVSPLLARIYSPEDFGLLAVYFSIVSIISVVINLRYETAIVLPKEDDEAIDLAFLSGIIAFGLSILLLLTVFIFNRPLVNLIGHREFNLYLYLVPLSTFFYGCVQIFNYWLTRSQNFNALAYSNTLKAASMAGVQLGWGSIVYAGAFGLILGQIAGNFFSALYLLVKSVSQFKNHLKKGMAANLGRVFVDYKRFPLYSSWATLINAVSQNMPALLLAVLFSPVVAGFYAVAARIIMVPAAMIGQSVRQVYFQRASQQFNEGRSIYPLYKKMTLNLFYMAFLPFTIIVIWGRPLFEIILGSAWGEAGIYASILAFWQFVGFINPPSMASLFILNLNNIQLILEIVSLLLRLLALYCGAFIFADITITLVLFTLAGIIVNLSLIGYIFFKLRKNSYTRIPSGKVARPE